MKSVSNREETGRKGYIVKEIIDVLIPYGRQNIAIGEHTEEKSNYMAILRHVPNTKMIYRDIYRTR
jgi:hypothetical protein